MQIFYYEINWIQILQCVLGLENKVLFGQKVMLVLQ